MRLIDADELLEHVGRDRLDSRERIAQMIKNAPTVCDIDAIRTEIANEKGTFPKEHYIRIIDKYTEQEPTDEMVHVETLHQVMWERDIAIEQLRELGYGLGQKIEPCDDAVSRQAVLEIANQHTLTNDYLAIQNLPSVRPQEQTKEEHLDVFEVANAPWIFLDNCANSGYYCSKCKKKLVKEGWSETVKKINFCPDCGAKMNEDNSN